MTSCPYPPPPPSTVQGCAVGTRRRRKNSRPRPAPGGAGLSETVGTGTRPFSAGPSRLHELHESKLMFVSRVEFIRSKLSNFPAPVSGVRWLYGGAALHDMWSVTSTAPGSPNIAHTRRSRCAGRRRHFPVQKSAQTTPLEDGV